MLGVAALLVVLIVDLPEVGREGLFGRDYEGAKASEASGFYLETAGAILLLVCGVLTAVLGPRRRSGPIALPHVLAPRRPRMAGEPSWFEIGSGDTAQGRTFYGGLFGWTFGDDGTVRTPASRAACTAATPAAVRTCSSQSTISMPQWNG